MCPRRMCPCEVAGVAEQSRLEQRSIRIARICRGGETAFRQFFEQTDLEACVTGFVSVKGRQGSCIVEQFQIAVAQRGGLDRSAECGFERATEHPCELEIGVAAVVGLECFRLGRRERAAVAVVGDGDGARPGFGGNPGGRFGSCACQAEQEFVRFDPEQPEQRADLAGGQLADEVMALEAYGSAPAAPNRRLARNRFLASGESASSGVGLPAFAFR